MTGSPASRTTGALAGRTVVLVHTRPVLDVVVQAMRRVRAAGGEIVLIGPDEQADTAALSAADVRVPLARRDARDRSVAAGWGSAPSRIATAAALARAALWRALRKGLGATTVWWLTARRTPDAMAALARADVITALDAGAIYVVWQAARRNQRAAAVNGIGPTMEHLGLDA